MLIVMDKDATPEMIQGVVGKIEALGYAAQPIPGGERVAIGILRNPRPVDPALFLDMPGVMQAIPVSKAYKLVSREMKREDTVITFTNGLTIGKGRFVVMAGPCAIESENQALTIARLVKAEGAQIFRGGAFKPRTSPYSYQGLGPTGLKILDKVRQVRRMQVEMGIESLHVEVDGGIGPSNARRAAEAGADVLVAGSSVFRGEGTVTENYGAIQRALAVDV